MRQLEKELNLTFPDDYSCGIVMEQQQYLCSNMDFYNGYICIDHNETKFHYKLLVRSSSEPFLKQMKSADWAQQFLLKFPKITL